MGRYFDPLTDWSFKQLFGSEPNKEILIEFLNDLRMLKGFFLHVWRK